MNAKNPDILLVGASVGSHRSVSSSLKSALRGMDKSWNPVFNGCGSFAVAAIAIPARKALDIVHVANNTCMTQGDLENGCERLVKVLLEHPNSPAVVIEDDELIPLSSIFELEGIAVYCGPLLNAVVQRANARAEANANAA